MTDRHVPPVVDLITSDPAVMGGRRVFRGTRVPVEVLFENLDDGLTVDEVLDSYPTLRRDDVMAVLALRDRALAVLDLVPDVPLDPGDETPRPYTTDRIHVLRELETVRRPEGFETD